MGKGQRAWAKPRRKASGEAARGRLARRLRYEALEPRLALAVANVFFEFADVAAPGTPLASLSVGHDYLMRVFIQDNRGTDADGVFQAYFDMSYSAALLTVNGALTHGPQYDVRPLGNAAVDGVIDAAGGASDGLPTPPGDHFLLFTLPIHTDAAGTLSIAAQPDDGSNNKVEFFFDSQPVTDIQFVGNSITIQGAEIVVAPTSGLTTTEAGGTATFTVVLSQQPTANVTVGLSSSDTTEGTVGPASLTFTSANWNTAQTVTVTGVNDAIADGSVGYSIVTAAAVSSDSNYSGKNTADVAVTNQDNDAPGITVVPTSGLTTTEAGGTTTFTVKLDSEPTANVTIGLSSSDTTEGTVAPASLTFTVANWSTPQTVTITGVNDAVADGNVAYSIVTAAATSADPNYSGRNAADVAVTNQDNDAAGITVVPTSGLTTTEAGGTATFTVKLDSEPSANVTIGLSSSDTTEGTVAPASLTFTVANWNTPQTVTITGVNDDQADGNIAYSIVTAAATSTDPAYGGRNAADVAVTNQDNDPAGITVVPTSGLLTTEAGGTATFTVKLNSEPTANVTIGLSSSDTTEGTIAPASLTFTVANWNTPQTVTVTGVNDALADGSIAYSIVTTAATSTDPNYSGRNAADVAVTNQDNDSPAITVAPTSGLTTTEAGGTATFTVRLDSEPTANVTIGLSSSDTTEGTVAPASLTFTIANWNTPQTVTITGVNDDQADGNIAYAIVTAAATSTDPAYSGRNAADVQVTNQDNDAAGITVTPTSGLTTTEAGGTATFTVKLNSQPTANVTIGLSSSDTTEGTVVPASLTFTAANWNTPQTVTVTGVSDAIDDGDVAYTIVTAAATSTDPGYSGRNAADVSVTTQDDDTAGITVTPTTGLTTTEVGGTATFTVRLNSQPTANVTIGLTSSDTTEGTVSPASLTFTAANWNVTQTVTITGVNDTAADGNVGYSIVTAAATSTDSSYQGRDADNVSLTNTDDEQIAVRVVRTTQASEAGPVAGLFTVSQTSVTASETRVAYSIGGSATAGTDYTALSGTAIIPPGQLSVPISVGVLDDQRVEGMETVIVTLTTIQAGDPQLLIDSAASSATVEIADNESGRVGIVATTSGNETGPVSIVFTISQDGIAPTDTVINLALSGSATSGADFTAPPATVTIPAGQTSATVTVPVINDTVVEANETLIVTMSLGNHSSLVALDPNQTAATATIADNDSAQVGVAAAAQGNEAGPVNGRFTITQTTASSVATTVSYTIGGTATSGSDFTAVSGSAVILAGQTSVEVVIAVQNDAIVEPTENVSITLTSLTGAALVTINPAQSTASLDIADNDSAQVSIAAQAGGSEAGPAAGSFLVSLSAASSTATTINYQVGGTATAGTDYAALAGSVTIPAGSQSAVINVNVLDDQRFEGTETVIVTLTSVAAGDPQITLSTGAAAATVSIADNESGLISIAATTAGSETGPTNGRFTVTQGGITATNTVIAYQVAGSASAGSDYQTLTGTVTIPAAATTAIIDVSVLDDQLVEGPEGVHLTLTSITSGQAGLAVDPSADDATVSIADNDIAQLSIEQTAHTAEAGAVAGSFTLRLDRPAAVDVVVAYSVSGTAGGGDFAPLSGTATIPAGQTTATIIVSPVDDAIVEATETVIVTLTGATPGSPSVVINAASDDASLDIVDNDSAQVSIAATAAANEAGAVHGQFTVSLTAASSTDTVVAVALAGTAAAGSDYAAIPATVTIPAGATSATINVATIDDLAVEGTESVTATVTTITSGDPQITLATGNATATLNITDNDSATVAFAAATSTAIEPAGSHTVQVRLSLPAGGELARPVTINITNPAGGTAGTGDFALTTTTVTFAAGSHNGDTKPVVLSLVNDGTMEPDETVNLALAIGTDTTGRTSLGSPAQHVVTITDDPITASLSGIVWADTNGNGHFDAGEVKLQGVTVKLTGTSNGGAAVTRTITTDSQGTYRFANLPGGTYSILEQQPVAMMDGAESLGTIGGVANGTVGADRFTNIVLPAAGSGVNYNFGEFSLQAQYVNARLFTVSALTRNAIIRDIVLQAERAAASTPSQSPPANNQIAEGEGEGEAAFASETALFVNAAATPLAPIAPLNSSLPPSFVPVALSATPASAPQIEPLQHLVQNPISTSADPSLNCLGAEPDVDLFDAAAIPSTKSSDAALTEAPANLAGQDARPETSILQSATENADRSSEPEQQSAIDKLLEDESWLISLADAE
jgi:hypothetical protein